MDIGLTIAGFAIGGGALGSAFLLYRARRVGIELVTQTAGFLRFHIRVFSFGGTSLVGYGHAAVAGSSCPERCSPSCQWHFMLSHYWREGVGTGNGPISSALEWRSRHNFWMGGHGPEFALLLVLHGGCVEALHGLQGSKLPRTARRTHAEQY